jgi:hypothetical protein
VLPVQRHGIVSAMFLYHLIRQSLSGIPRSVFVAHFNHQQATLTPETIRTAAMRAALAVLCQREGIPTHSRTGYPLQSRPHDLTEADLPLLMNTMATPKVNGLEAFFFGSRAGFAIVFRSGIMHTYPWSPSGPPLYPLLMEGEALLTDAVDGVRFVAYDVAVAPVQSYVHRGRFPTRHACLRALVRQLRRHHCGPSFREPL